MSKSSSIIMEKIQNTLINDKDVCSNDSAIDKENTSNLDSKID